MKIYNMKIKQKSGLLSPLQSDTIYGHFCWRLKDALGEAALIDFITLYQQKKPVFLLSDGLLKDNETIYFPRPYLNSKPVKKTDKKEKILYFSHQKKVKEKKFLTLDEMNGFLANGEVIIKAPAKADIGKTGKNKPLVTESLRTSVQINRESYTSQEGMLFTYNPSYTRDDVEYCILIKVLNEELFAQYECEEIIKDIFIIGFGKKKSSGYGQFEVNDCIAELIDLKEPGIANSVMFLGNYLPDNNDNLSPISYEFNTKYGRLGEELSLSDNPFKKPAIFFTAGSCFGFSTMKEFYGRVTQKGEISPANPDVVQFGMPFFLHFKSLV